MGTLHVPLWAWAATAVAVVLILGADLIVSFRRRDPPGLR